MGLVSRLRNRFSAHFLSLSRSLCITLSLSLSITLSLYPHLSILPSSVRGLRPHRTPLHFLGGGLLPCPLVPPARKP